MCSSVKRLYFSKINYTSSTHLQRIHRNKALPAISDSVVESFLSPAGAASISGPPFSAGPFEFSAQFFELSSFAPQSATSFPPVSTPSMLFLEFLSFLNPVSVGTAYFSSWCAALPLTSRLTRWKMRSKRDAAVHWSITRTSANWRFRHALPLS